ncbi:ERP44, partial [Cervus elaphus hippelaphus]
MLQLLYVTWAEDKIVPTWKIARAEWRGLMILIEYFSIQELTEEGLPFLILFHMKEDTESLEIFQNEVARQLISEKGTINFLHADCDKFRHPLLHIQKTPADCPVIAIDSFRHMYVFGDFRDVLYRISKYPTLKLFRNGMMMKREYRGQRSVKALADYIRQQKSDPIQELHILAEANTLD